jgi:hypothetical protein
MGTKGRTQAGRSFLDKEKLHDMSIHSASKSNAKVEFQIRDPQFNRESELGRIAVKRESTRVVALSKCLFTTQSHIESIQDNFLLSH